MQSMAGLEATPDVLQQERKTIMATKKGKKNTAHNKSNSPTLASRRKLFTGGIIVAGILALAIGIRLFMQRNLVPRLQGAINGHYTRGTAGAPVVLKEFSDYT